MPPPFDDGFLCLPPMVMAVAVAGDVVVAGVAGVPVPVARGGICRGGPAFPKRQRHNFADPPGRAQVSSQKPVLREGDPASGWTARDGAESHEYEATSETDGGDRE